MKKTITIKKITTILLTLTLASGAIASDLSEQERQKRNMVKGIYQLTDGALALCPKANAATFKQTLTAFKQKFPKVIQLINESTYLAYAKSSYDDDFENNRAEMSEPLTKQCLFKQKMLKNMMITPEGKQTMAMVLHTLQSS